jgi:hypothetical protein
LPEATLSEADWALLMAVLQAMKPALVDLVVADASVADVHDLTPDERIEVALALRAHLAGGAARIRRGTDLADVADRLDWFERETDDRDT